ncbi:MAG: peptidase, partial [Thermodesulfobacteriota bacterium]
MPPTIEILKPGTFRPLSGPDITLTAADLAAMASAYRKDLHEAPLVVGHPKTDDPAYGWVEKLEVAGGRLLAVPDQVDPQFAQAVRAGRFKRISASLFRPDSRGNPVPGTWSLRHV